MNIHHEVLQRLQQSYGQSPESSSKRIYILPDVDSTIQGEWEQRLRETMNSEGERLILIPYKFGESHWIGIAIEFQGHGKIKRANYIDPVNEMHSLPDDLQRSFEEVFPNNAFHSIDMLKTNDPSRSVEVTIKNLHRAADPQQFLGHELTSLNIRKSSELLNEITETETRISRYTQRQRFDAANSEKEHLQLLESLKDLGAEIDRHAQNSFVSTKNNQSEIETLKERLKQGKIKLNLDSSIILSEEIDESENDLNRFQQQGRLQDAEREKERLFQLQELRRLEDEISKFGQSCEVVVKNRPTEKLLHIDELWCVDANEMPSCAEKSVMELLVQLGHIVSGHAISSETKSISKSLIERLRGQMEKEKLFSNEIRTIVQNLEQYVYSDDYLSAIPIAEKLLKKLRPINVSEIERLVSKAKEAADLIRDQDIVLLVGDTGSGKSTTIQFLAGCKMVKTKVEVEKGRYLDHITTEGPITNSGLKHVTSSAHMKSETRYIAPVIVPLRDVLSSYETGTITLCDTPGFGDTAGPEVDIANGVGVVEALKGCKSVKILALLSSHNLGDRAQGIQKLAYKLINMVQGIERRLDAVLYGFMKFPSEKDIHAMLLDLKREHVDQDSQLQSDHVFMEVLIDMLRKTEFDNLKIDPIRDKPRELITKLRKMSAIKYPEDVFQFSMSSETQSTIEIQMQRDKSSITCALKQKGSEVEKYYFNKLKRFHNVINHRLVADAYKNAALELSQNINEFCIEVMKKFNRAVASLDGLTVEDLDDYKSCLAYVDDIKILREDPQVEFPTSEALMENITSELQKLKDSLEGENLHSHSTKIYLSNLDKLKSVFPYLTSYCTEIGTYFKERFGKLIESSSTLIDTDDFSAIADIFLKISKASDVLKVHFNEQLDDKYKSIVKQFMDRLLSRSETAARLLSKVRLDQSDIEELKNSMKTLRSAKNTFVLQEFISTYVSNNPGENGSTLNDIYNEFISKIEKYFEEIVRTIETTFKNRGDHSLGDIKKLMEGMQNIRKIPELESKTAAIYYRTVESIREKTYQLQMDAEKLLMESDQQEENKNYTKVARLISRLKNSEWINDISPGTYDVIHCIEEELIASASLLESRLTGLNVSLECPNNIAVAKEIVEKLESMRVLDNSSPMFKEIRQKILRSFAETIQKNFDRIQNVFRLQDIAVYEKKQRLKELEDMRQELSNLHSANIHLREFGYSNIEEVNRESQDLKLKHQRELELLEKKKRKSESELTELRAVAQTYSDLSRRQTSTELPTIGAIQDVIANVQKDIDDTTQLIHVHQREHSISFSHLESIKQKYDDLIKNHTLTTEEKRFLSEKKIESYKSLDRLIKDTENSIKECERNEQRYDFTNGLDASMADNALLYIDQCETVNHIRVSGIAADTKLVLEKYIREYGHFLEQEIRLKFKNIINTHTVGNRDFQDSSDLTRRLGELSSLGRYKRVFHCMNGETKIEVLREKFITFHQTLNTKMKEFKLNDNHEELQRQLTIVQATMCLDRFLGNEFLNNGFTALYNEYIAVADQDFKKNYETVLKCICNGDYAKANIALIDVQNVLNDKKLSKIKDAVNSSINNLMSETKSIVCRLDLNSRATDDCAKLVGDIKQNITKIRTASNSNCNQIIKLFDDETKNVLSNFDKDFNEILSPIILKQMSSIETDLDNDYFLEAEQSMDNLTRIVLNELQETCKLVSITEECKKINERLEKIPENISKQYVFTDINNCSMQKANTILNSLKMAEKHYSVKYNKAIRVVQTNIREAFNKNIERVKQSALHERASKLKSLSDALKYLSNDLRDEFNGKIIEEQDHIEHEKDMNKKHLEECLSLNDESDDSLKKIGELYEKCQKERIYDISEQLNKEVSKKLCNYQKQIEADLANQCIQHAILIAEKSSNTSLFYLNTLIK